MPHIIDADAFYTYLTGELGKPYHYGSEGPDQFDCSGLVQFVYRHFTTYLPRTAHEQQAFCTPVTQPLLGDLVFYGRPAHHVGIYIDKGVMIDAPDVGQPVKYDNVGSATSYGRVPDVIINGGVVTNPKVDTQEFGKLTDVLSSVTSFLAALMNPA